MTGTPAFLGVDDVLAIHDRVVEEFGGDPSIRDRGLLESATRMPAARFAGRFLHEGLADMAAACLFHLCKNHAFVDGNKRTALAAALVFLLLNDARLAAADGEVEALVMGVAGGRVSKETVTEFFRSHVEAWLAE